MSLDRYDDQRSPLSAVVLVAAGALAGFALGMLAARHGGDLSSIVTRVRGGSRRRGGAGAEPVSHDDDDDDDEESDDWDDDEDDDDDDPSAVAEGDALRREIEERVLWAFTNDPILAERAIDIGALDDAEIELSGWVKDAAEARHAVTIAGGVPGVERVANELLVGKRERTLDKLARHHDPGAREAFDLRA
jgi:hypothetical protein